MRYEIRQTTATTTLLQILMCIVELLLQYAQFKVCDMVRG